MNSVKGPDRQEKTGTAMNDQDDFEQKKEILERMVDRYQLSLLHLCYAYLHDEELAKDAVQETFVKAFRKLGSFCGNASEITWLNRIAINTCKDIRKSSWFRHVDRSVTPEMLPETESRAEEKDENLTVAIMTLPVKLREAALMCWLQGMTVTEAADTLGISHQAVSGRLDRARKKLRCVLEGRDDHDAV